MQSEITQRIDTECVESHTFRDQQYQQHVTLVQHLDRQMTLSDDLRTQYANMNSVIQRHFNEQGTILSRILETQKATKDIDAEDGRLQTASTPVVMPRPYIAVHASRYREMACSIDCICNCHQQNYLQPTPILNKILGRLFIGHTGAPFQDRRCNLATCKRRSMPAIHVVYYFPRWFLMRAIFLSVSDSMVPSISLSFPRVVPGGSTIFRYIRTGNTEGMKDLFHNGQASAGDICGASGLSVLSYALMSYALYGGCVEVCEILISEGSDPFAINNTPLPKYVHLIYLQIYTVAHNIAQQATKHGIYSTTTQWRLGLKTPYED